MPGEKRYDQRAEPHKGFHVFVECADKNEQRNQQTLHECDLHRFSLLFIKYIFCPAALLQSRNLGLLFKVQLVVAGCDLDVDIHTLGTDGAKVVLILLVHINVYIAGHFLAGTDVHIADAQLINRNAALHQLAGALRLRTTRKMCWLADAL